MSKSKLKIVDWGSACGRYYLEVAGILVAMEGDMVRECSVVETYWTLDLMKEVIKRYEEQIKDER